MIRGGEREQVSEGAEQNKRERIAVNSNLAAKTQWLWAQRSGG